MVTSDRNDIIKACIRKRRIKDVALHRPPCQSVEGQAIVHHFDWPPSDVEARIVCPSSSDLLAHTAIAQSHFQHLFPMHFGVRNVTVEIRIETEKPFVELLQRRLRTVSYP